MENIFCISAVPRLKVLKRHICRVRTAFKNFKNVLILNTSFFIGKIQYRSLKNYPAVLLPSQMRCIEPILAFLRIVIQLYFATNEVPTHPIEKYSMNYHYHLFIQCLMNLDD